jgi:hypothetical protein
MISAFRGRAVAGVNEVVCEVRRCCLGEASPIESRGRNLLRVDSGVPCHAHATPGMIHFGVRSSLAPRQASCI